MEQATEVTPTRATPAAPGDHLPALVRDARAALTAHGIPPMVVQQILPTSDLDDRPLVRMGTWDPDSLAALTAALTARRPLIGHRDTPPHLPPAV
jgi:hypothetical protein